jgi:hypothetical protein
MLAAAIHLRTSTPQSTFMRRSIPLCDQLSLGKIGAGVTSTNSNWISPEPYKAALITRLCLQLAQRREEGRVDRQPFRIAHPPWII